MRKNGMLGSDAKPGGGAKAASSGNLGATALAATDSGLGYAALAAKSSDEMKLQPASIETLPVDPPRESVVAPPSLQRYMTIGVR